MCKLRKKMIKRCEKSLLVFSLVFSMGISMGLSTGISVQAKTTPGKEWKRAAVLVDKVADKDENTMVSPLSLDLALAMTGNGALNTTKKELVQYLGRSINDYNKLVKNYYSDDVDELKVANSIWVTEDKGYELRDSFVSKLKKNYRAQIRNVDFSDKQTAKTINKWVKKNTGNMIPKIIDKTEKTTRMMLINALYFDSQWRDSFKAERTVTDTFTNSNGQESQVSFMNGDAEFYYQNENATGFGKQYKNSRYEFIAVLPEQTGDFELADLKLPSLLKSKTSSIDVHVKMPKYTFSYGTEDKLKSILQDLGIKQAFTNYARFDNMLTPDTENRLKISKIIQKTKIIVDEDGTKAAAATVVDMVKTTSVGPSKSVQVVLDRPFAFMIYDTEANTVLFVGKVNVL